MEKQIDVFAVLFSIYFRIIRSGLVLLSAECISSFFHLPFHFSVLYMYSREIIRFVDTLYLGQNVYIHYGCLVARPKAKVELIHFFPVIPLRIKGCSPFRRF